MKHNVILIFLIFFFFNGCSTSTEAMNKSVKIHQQPKYQVPAKPKPQKPRAKGSLFSGATSSLFSDRKALQLGDIVYITIKEGPNKVETKSERTTSLQNGAQTQKGGSVNNVPNLPVVGGIIQKTASLLNDILGVGFTLPSRSGSFKATAESKVTDKFEYDISAVITKVYQNGNYFVEGLKYVVINGQKHTLKISGVMNPQELVGNTIVSNKIANLKVVYFKDGDEQEYMKKPWGTRVLETISPF